MKHSKEKHNATCTTVNLRGALHNTVLQRGALQQHNTTSTSIVLTECDTFKINQKTN